MPWETLRNTPPRPRDGSIDAVRFRRLLGRGASASLLLCSELCKTNSSSSCCSARIFKALLYSWLTWFLVPQIAVLSCPRYLKVFSLK